LDYTGTSRHFDRGEREGVAEARGEQKLKFLHEVLDCFHFLLSGSPSRTP
jgi:hypothetical protein